MAPNQSVEQNELLKRTTIPRTPIESSTPEGAKSDATTDIERLLKGSMLVFFGNID